MPADSTGPEALGPSGWISLAPYWDGLKAIAQRRNQQKRRYGSSRYWTEDTHFVGLCGEKVYGILTEQPIDEELKARGDGGVDFPGSVDIKGVPFWSDPWLKIPQADGFKAHWYGLVGLHLAHQCGYYIGMVRRSVIAKAPLKDWGHGPSYSLSPGQVHPDWKGPPPLRMVFDPSDYPRSAWGVD